MPTPLLSACPKCKLQTLYYEEGEPDQTSGPPDAWSQGTDDEVYCNNCGWATTTDVQEYLD